MINFLILTFVLALAFGIGIVLWISINPRLIDDEEFFDDHEKIFFKIFGVLTNKTVLLQP